MIPLLNKLGFPQWRLLMKCKPSWEALWKLNRLPLHILNPCFYMRPELLLILDTWSMKLYTCMNFHTLSHLKILIQSKPSCSKDCLSHADKLFSTLTWMLCFGIQISMNVHPCHVSMEVCVKTWWITTPAPVQQTSLEATVRQVCFFSWVQPTILLYKCQPTYYHLFLFPFAMGKCLMIEDVYTASHLLSTLYLASCNIFQLGLTQWNWKKINK